MHETDFMYTFMQISLFHSHFMNKITSSVYHNTKLFVVWLQWVINVYIMLRCRVPIAPQDYMPHAKEFCNYLCLAKQLDTVRGRVVDAKLQRRTICLSIIYA